MSLLRLLDTLDAKHCNKLDFCFNKVRLASRPGPEVGADGWVVSGVGVVGLVARTV